MKHIHTYESFLNEAATKNAINAYNVAIELDEPDMESFFEMLSNYFERNAGSITNMNAKKIAEHLFSAYVLIKKRTSK
jgi:hypothetical protein